MRKSRRIKVCVYCGKKCFTTRDHIPPKTLFGNRTSDLITVPCCESCHEPTILDDEYFRDVIIIREDSATHPEAKKVAEAMMRSFQKSEQQRFARRFVSNIQLIEIISKGGLYLGKKPAIKVDVIRLKKVIERITRGLFYKITKRRLRDDFIVSSLTPDDFPLGNEEDDKRIISSIMEPLRKRPHISIGKSVFDYKFIFTKDVPDASVWLYRFYNKVLFLSFTMSQKMKANGLAMKKSF